MIELSTYLWTVTGLIAIIGLFVAHYLREPRIKDSISKLKKENTALITEKTESQKRIFDLTEKQNEYQKQITEQLSKIDIASKYVFDRRMGCLKAVFTGKLYCTACFLNFNEVKLHTDRIPAQCPECGTEYPPK